MAKAGRRTTRRAETRAPASQAGGKADPKEAIIDAFMALAAEESIRNIGLADIAERAGVSLATLRETYSGKVGILVGFSRRIDLAVLADGPADPASEPRDRLFEIVMRRLDALAPYKPAIRRMMRTASCHPGFAAILHRLSVRSQRWTLAAAGISHSGLRGRIAAEGLVLVYAETVRTWLDDGDPDLGRTMATLDRSLRRGERGMQMLSDLCAFIPRTSRIRRGRGGDEAAAN
jgi:AcrR family transcriptional regulator